MAPRNKAEVKSKTSKPVVNITTKAPGRPTPDQQQEMVDMLNAEGTRIARKVSKIGAPRHSDGQTPTKGKR